MKMKLLTKLSEILCCLFLLLQCLTALSDCFFSAELTDEAFSVAEPYMVSEGALPYVNNWSQIPGFALLIAPFLWLYTTITGETAAVILYTRIVAYFLTLISMALVF